MAKNITAVANDDGTVDITAEQGKTQIFDITLYSDTAMTIPVNLTGKAARGQVRAKFTDASALLTMSCAITTPANGTITCTIDPDHTAALGIGNSQKEYVYDVEYYSGTPPNEEVDLAVKGKYFLNPEVTK